MGKYKQIILIFLGVFIIALLIYGVFYFGNITGRVLLDLELDSEEGQNTQGTLKISLKEGELIPASSKIVFENGGNKYEYVLSELVSEELVEGDFYVEGSQVSGTGQGYGLIGEKETPTEVNFLLDILTVKDSNEDSSSEGGGESSGDEVPDEISDGESEEVIEEVSETTIEENIEEEITSEDVPSEESAEETIAEEVNTDAEEVVEENKDDVTESSEPEVPVEESQPEEPSITGNIVSGLFGFTTNFFLGITGQVSLEIENEVQGKVSLGNEFVYDLKEGQTAEIAKGSVKTNSEELSDDEVNLEIEGNKAILTTSYSEKEKGFGEEYLKNGKKTITVNLPALNFTIGEDLKTSLIYGEEEIVSLTVLLESGKITTEAEILSTGEQTEEDLTNKILELNTTLEIDLSLSNEERTLLSDEFGNASLRTTKAELVDERIVIGYELGEYWIEYSYDSSITEEKLDFLMETDRIKFLKDLARKLSEEKNQSQKLDELIIDHEI